jgi:hypothetical protein
MFLLVAKVPQSKKYGQTLQEAKNGFFSSVFSSPVSTLVLV